MFINRGIVGIRQKVAIMLGSKYYDATMIILIVLYTLLVLVQFGLDEQEFYRNEEPNIFKAELAILGLFIVEIVLHVFAYRLLYLKDYWNILDIMVIKICLVFVLLDLLLDKSVNIKGFFKIRGIFRLLRIFILTRKLNAVRIRRDLIKKRMATTSFSLKPPLERVLEMLSDLRD
jgi:hypothetical protein